jgi:predicted naringenin-chalcone synthase
VVADKIIRTLSPGRKEAELIRKIFEGTLIEKRYSVIRDYANDRLTGEFFGPDFPRTAPGMSSRNDLYKREAPVLAREVAEKTLRQWGGKRADITHVVSVSCTGLIAPGIEFLLIDDLGLQRSVQRLGINFMGCFGAFKGLAVARALALEDPGRRVLVVCTELCSLHFHVNGKVDTHVANALFADGAAAIVVGCNPGATETPLFDIVRMGSYAVEDSLPHMTWEAADEGLVMRLSREVPALIDRHVAGFARTLLGPDLAFEACDWAVHPGGKSILQAVEKTCGLLPDQTVSSWEVMKQYGNMSSATFLFVLEHQLRRENIRAWSLGMGFGPGLSMEGTLLRRPDP